MATIVDFIKDITAQRGLSLRGLARETGINAWDIAAGAVLVREAGGFVSEIDGGRNFMAKSNVLAANSLLHAPLGKLLRTAASVVG